MSKRLFRQGMILGTAAGLSAVPHVFGGYTLNTLATFDGSNGSNPTGLTLSGNTLYGTTQQGGANAYGAAFSVPATGGVPTLLGSFNNSNGANPRSGLIVSGNTLYGTTISGGTDDDGAVFSIPVSGGTPKLLASFNGSNGGSPQGLTISGNTLYGATYNGGDNNDGVVFSVPIAGGTPTVLASFNGSDGANPLATLTLSGNTFYGTTEAGGASGGFGYGTVFSIPVTGGTPTLLASFNNVDGSVPVAGLTLVNNTLYGTTARGGATHYGAIFSVPVSGGSPSLLGSFTNTDGANPMAGLTLLGNTLYGTTQEGGANGYGTVFSLPVTGGTPVPLVSFNITNGANPQSGLVLSGNTFYGTAFNGENGGTVYSLTFDHALLCATLPSNFGSQVGSLAITGGGGNYNTASVTFAPTPTGFLAVSGFNPSTDTETYALKITDSVPGNLAADLADAAAEINAGTYSGYSVTASTTDPLSILSNGYDFYITITSDTLGTGSPYFGFDFTQLNGTSDALSVTAAAVVPEPAGMAVLAAGGVGLLRRRRGGAAKPFEARG